MPERLGLCVAGEANFPHVLGLTRAAQAAGKSVEIFFTGDGVRLTKEPGFSELIAAARSKGSSTRTSSPREETRRWWRDAIGTSSCERPAMGKKVAVLIRDKERQYEGLRSSLGLLLEDHQIDMFVLDHEVDMTEEYYDNMGFIDEMGGSRFSNVPANVEKHGFLPASLDEVAGKLRDHEIVIPF
jgi:hypothetical protein